jgi:hypothetical protein
MRVRELREHTGAQYLCSLRTANVLFLLAAHADHLTLLRAGVRRVVQTWGSLVTSAEHVAA